MLNLFGVKSLWWNEIISNKLCIGRELSPKFQLEFIRNIWMHFLFNYIKFSFKPVAGPTGGRPTCWRNSVCP